MYFFSLHIIIANDFCDALQVADISSFHKNTGFPWMRHSLIYVVNSFKKSDTIKNAEMGNC